MWLYKESLYFKLKEFPWKQYNDNVGYPFLSFFLNLRHIFLKGLFRPFTTSSEKAQSLFASIIYIFQKKCGPDLFFKIIFRHWNCFLSSVTTDGEDGLGEGFQILMHYLQKNKNYYVLCPWWSLFEIFFITLQGHFVRGTLVTRRNDVWETKKFHTDDTSLPRWG